MNFCYLLNLYGFGGLEIQTILRAKDGLEKGNNSCIVSYPDSRVRKYAENLGFEVILLPKRPKIFNFLNFSLLANIFDRNQVDICIVPKSNLLGSAIIAKKLSKSKPKVIFYQQMQSGINKKDFYHNFIYNNLDGAIVLTEKMRQMILETTKINPVKTFVVPYGVKWQEFLNHKNNIFSNRSSFNLPDDAFIVGCIGRIEPKKGQDTLLEAYKLANLENSKLIFAGSVDDRKYFQKLQDYTKENDLTNRVEFLKFTYEVSRLMSTFDCLVVPSHSETFGMVVLEGMACSLPVIATNSGGIPEIIDNGINGLLFEPKNVYELANCLKKIYFEIELRNKIAEKGLEKVKIKFDYEKNVNKFFEVCALIANK